MRRYASRLVSTMKNKDFTGGGYKRYLLHIEIF